MDSQNSPLPHTVSSTADPVRQYELGLEVGEERLRIAFASAPIGMVLTDTQGRFIRCNDTYCAITGYSATELPGVSFLNLTHADDLEANRLLFQRLLGGDMPSYVIEKRIINKSGSPVWVRASATLLRDRQGDNIQVIGIVENIDTRKSVDERLAAQSRLDALGADVGKALTQSDNLSDCLKLCAGAIVRHLDAAFARIWTMNDASDTLELRASAGLYTHLDGPHSRVPVGAFKIGKIAQERLPHLTNDVLNDPRVSDRAWAKENGMVSFAGYPLLIGSRVVGVFGMFSRHLLAAATLDELGSVADSIAIGIERSRTEAELRAALQREKQAKQELEKSAKALLRSNEDLQHFVDASSHDLRSPLRTVHVMAAILAQKYTGKLDSRADELLGFIIGGAKRMDSLLSDLLTFSSASHTERPTELVSMNEALQEALDNLRTNIAESDAAVDAADLPFVMVHKTHLLQLFQNLIGNAIKYRSNAAPIIHISAKRWDAEWIIRVSDNGIGIDPQYFKSVFEAFKRLHGKEYPGNGIGLATCKRIVESYGGTIWVESAVNAGSTFLSTFPAHDV